MALGLGCSKLRHKLAALLHALVPKILRPYCAGVVGFTADQGTEALLVDAPQVNLEEHLRTETVIRLDTRYNI